MSIKYSGKRPARLTIIQCNSSSRCVMQKIGTTSINALRSEARREGWAVAVRARHSLVNDYCPLHKSEVATRAS